MGTASPEQISRREIDRVLGRCGWLVQDYAAMNIGAGLGVAVREFPLKTGFADYLLYVSGKVLGVNADQETQHLAQHPEYRSVPPIATESDSLRNGLKEANAQKALNCARKSDALRVVASAFENAPRRTRTFAVSFGKHGGF